MWKNKQPKICNIYLRRGNHVIIIKKIELYPNIGKRQGRWPSTIESTILTVLIFTLKKDRKREVIAPLQQLNQAWCVLGHFFSQLVQVLGSSTRDVLVSIDIILWLTRTLSWLNRRRHVGQFRIKRGWFGFHFFKTIVNGSVLMCLFYNTC